MSEEPRWLRAGFVGRPHGLDGSFHVAGVVEAVFGLLHEGAEVNLADGPRRVTRLAGHVSRPILRLQDSAARADAEALRGQEITIARSAAPQLDEDEWWADDLEGCAVRDGEERVGTVTQLLTLPSCEVLEVDRGHGAPTLLVPLVRDAVRDVDLQRGVIDVDLRFLGER